VTHSDSETSGACSNHVVKVITRTWTVTDACGNSASQAQTITVKDTTAPSFVNFAADATVECPSDTSPAATAAPTGTDSCSRWPYTTPVRAPSRTVTVKPAGLALTTWSKLLRGPGR